MAIDETINDQIPSFSTCAIFAAGTYYASPTLPPDCTIIAVDGGLDACQTYHIAPDIIIGDFDSVQPDALRSTTQQCSSLQTPASPSHNDQHDKQYPYATNELEESQFDSHSPDSNTVHTAQGRHTHTTAHTRNSTSGGDIQQLTEYAQSHSSQHPSPDNTHTNEHHTPVVITLPPDKDDTDLFAAVKLAWAKGARVFHLYGTLGARLDHTMGTFAVMASISRRDGSVYAYGDRMTMTMITNGELHFSASTLAQTGIVSVLSYSDQSTGVSITGLVYEASNFTMENYTNKGACNEIVPQQPFSVSVEKGTLVVMYPDWVAQPTHTTHNLIDKQGMGDIATQSSNYRTHEVSRVMLCHPRCSTCAKARTWLQEHDVTYVERNIVDDPPTVQELTSWIAQSGLDVKRFFNTSGQQYRERNLKDRLATMSQESMIALLASDGMLIKRPLLVDVHNVFVGFKPEVWQDRLAYNSYSVEGR